MCYNHLVIIQFLQLATDVCVSLDLQLGVCVCACMHACVTVWMSQLDAWLHGDHNLKRDSVDTTTWLRMRRNIAALGFSSCCNCFLPSPTTWSVTTVCGHHHLICDCMDITLSDLTTYVCDPGKNVWFTGEGHASSGGSTKSKWLICKRGLRV